MDQDDGANFYIHSTLMSTHSPYTTSTSAPQAYLGKLIFSYQLLDTLAWASGWPSYTCLPVVHRCPAPKVTQQLDRVINHLKNWSAIIPAARETAMRALSYPRQQSAAERQSVVAPPNFETSQIMDVSTANDFVLPQTFKFALMNLEKASEHGKRRQTHDVLEQWYSVAFVIGAFRPVSVICAFSTI